MAASVGLAMAFISIAKLLLFLCALICLTQSLVSRGHKPAPNAALACTTPIVLIILAAFALSLTWTVAPPSDAYGSFAKYGKLLVIVILVLLIRTRREAVYALSAFVLAQLFLFFSSWMLFWHLPVPWATSGMAFTEYAVFSSYLDQGIMGAVVAAICWHLRSAFPGRYGKHLAIAIALLSISNVLFVLSGRSGHVVAIALLSVAIMWELPRRFRPVVVVLPFVILAVLYFGSSKVRDRLNMVKSEAQAFSSTQPTDTSSGIRLSFWLSAMRMIKEQPVAGLGVGSWSTEYNRMQRAANPAHQNINGNGNPHQEYLQWGLQLGVPGLVLLMALMVAVFRDTLGMPTATARAAQSTLLGLAVACLFNSSLYDALIGDFFCVALGLLLALGSLERQLARTQVSQFSTGTLPA